VLVLEELELDVLLEDELAVDEDDALLEELELLPEPEFEEPQPATIMTSIKSPMRFSDTIPPLQRTSLSKTCVTKMQITTSTRRLSRTLLLTRARSGGQLLADPCGGIAISRRCHNATSGPWGLCDFMAQC
jgi:hypothetical protein